jgi:hypothetical protein
VSTAPGALDAVAAPLDGARRGVLQLLTRHRPLARIVGNRDLRIPLFATAQVAVLLALAVACPVWLFVAGPLLLGVPHLVSDVRYLGARRRVAREVVVVGLVAAAGVLALRGLELAHVRLPVARLEVVAGATWVLVAVAVGARERRNAWPLLALPGIAAVGIVAEGHASVARLVLAQGHNVVAIVVWLLLFRRNRRAAALPIVAVAVGSVAILSGATLPWTLRAGGLEGLGVDLQRVGAFLTPGAPARLAAAAAILFVFLQAVHYAAWLTWIPQDELPGQGTFTFRMTARALVKDLGLPLLLTAAVVSLALIAAAAVSLAAAVRAYMSLAAFHGYFELAMLGYFAARGRLTAAP